MEIVGKNPETITKYVIDLPTIIYSIIRLTNYNKFIVASKNDLGAIKDYKKCFQNGYYIYIIDHPYKDNISAIYCMLSGNEK